MSSRTKPGRGIVRRQANGVVACLVRGEGETALGRATRVDNRVSGVQFL